MHQISKIYFVTKLCMFGHPMCPSSGVISCTLGKWYVSCRLCGRFLGNGHITSWYSLCKERFFSSFLCHISWQIAPGGVFWTFAVVLCIFNAYAQWMLAVPHTSASKLHFSHPVGLWVSCDSQKNPLLIISVTCIDWFYVCDRGTVFCLMYQLNFCMLFR